MSDHAERPCRCWLGVASAEHVRIGRSGGFMQVNHGKLSPLQRIHPGDRMVYYSPATEMRGKDRLQSFTAIGIVQNGDPYLGEMRDDLRAWRRDVDWLTATEAPIAPLLDQLSFTVGRTNWGYQMRFGLVEITTDDWLLIASTMRAIDSPSP